MKLGGIHELVEPPACLVKPENLYGKKRALKFIDNQITKKQSLASPADRPGNFNLPEKTHKKIIVICGRCAIAQPDEADALNS